MNKVILLALFMPAMAYGQIMENFETTIIPGWVQYPQERWSSDNNTPVSGLRSLHHVFDNPDAGTDLTGFFPANFHPDEGTARWSFSVRYGCDPSSSNNWAVFLLSDIDPSMMYDGGKMSGFAVGVNQIGYDDIVKLWCIADGEFTEVINSNVNWQTDIGPAEAARIIVEHKMTGEWSLTIFRLSNQSPVTVVGNDAHAPEPGWFTVLYRYTSTRDRLLWIDDLSVEGVFYEDKQPPSIKKSEPLGKNRLLVTFSEEPDVTDLVPSNFLVTPGSNRAVRIVRSGTTSCIIYFENDFENKKENTLVAGRLCDKSGNCIAGPSSAFVPFWAETGDVMITEIMADPFPSVALPEKEYIEIFNSTGSVINLKDWMLKTEEQSSPFPAIIMPPFSYMIVVQAQDTSLFSRFGETVGLKSFPTLTDGGRMIGLYDSTGCMIHGAEYSAKWYGNELKSEGGWSLEIIDPSFPFYYEGNWAASVSRSGGSPGKANPGSRSNRDGLFEGIVNVFPFDSLHAELSFTEPVALESNDIKEVTIDEKEIEGIQQSDPLMRSWMIKPSTKFEEGETYTLSVGENTTDFAGNKIGKNDFTFGLPGEIRHGDVLINEILFNPLPGDPDFIELINVSDKVIDVSRLILATVNDELHDTSAAVPVFTVNRCLLPGDLFTVTTGKKLISERYSSSVPEKIFETESLPSLPDDKGHLLLFNRELDLIDEITYDDDIHFKLITNTEGISLERIDPYLTPATGIGLHSASESSGWGTPGAPNSVWKGNNDAENEIDLSSSKITPDNDGNEDFLEIRMNPDEPGSVVSVTIFDETGSLVRKIASGFLAGEKAMFIWDGTADDGDMVETGIYIVYITMFNDKGKSSHWKKICTVIRG